MIPESVVDLSRLQFAATALYHFLFVPLTLGLSFILAIMESVYVMTGKQIYKDMTQFWGKLFGINFALGVTTGLTMEFEFGTNWAYYSHYVGDIFGAPLAIEGLMAFFLESTFVGLFFFGWDRLSKVKHLMTTWLVAIGSNFSALWILVANGWMQNPVGSEFSYETMRMEMTSFAEVILNPVAQVKFVHTVSAGYCTAAMFVLSISAWYMLKGAIWPLPAAPSRLLLALVWLRCCPSFCWVTNPVMRSAMCRKPSWPPLKPNGRPMKLRRPSPWSACPTMTPCVPTTPCAFPGCWA